jgi:Predicted oxidoreductases (related to aryl-alcohol dehydrogenases)
LPEVFLLKYVKMQGAGGGDELNVSTLALGTDKLASTLPDSEIFYLMDMFAEAGGNCIDTARVYCGGLSEEAIGRWFKQNGRRRDIVLSSKGCHPPIENMPHSRLSKEEMEHDLDLSLKALQTDCIDIYWLHRDDASRSVEEIIENINTFVKAGKIRLIGCSNWKSDRIQSANEYAARANLCGFSSSQIQWSLADTREEIYQDYAIVIMNEQEYGWYLKNKMPVFAFAAQAQGFFPKVAKSGIEALSEKTRARFESPENLKRLERVKQLSERLDISISAAALSYLTCNRLPTVAVIGSRTPEQLRESLEAADVSISPEEADKLFLID